MKKSVQLFISAFLVVVLVAGGLTLSSALAQPQAQQTDGGGMQRFIRVTGSGSASAQPDRAVVVVGVRTEADEASEALSQNNQQVSDLIDALQQAGIDQEDIQTQQISLFPRYSNQPTDSGQPAVTGYIATNTVQVQIDDITQVGTILDTAVQAGGNLIEQIRFEIADQSEVLQQARSQAFDNASEKAQQLAQLAGVTLGDVISIEETSSQPPIPFAVGGALQEDRAVPVEPGMQSVQVNLLITWEITGGTAQGGTLTPGIPQTGTTVSPTPSATRTATSGLSTPPAATETEPVDTATPGGQPTVDETATPIGNGADETATPPSGDETALPGTTPPADEENGASTADELRAQGADVRLLGNIQQPFIPVMGRILEVNDEQIQVFEFRSKLAAQDFADTVSQTGNRLGSLTTNLSTVHFFHEGDTIILYFGSDADLLDLLTRTFGDALTG